ncbi:hypothetical protein ACFQ34_16920 [Pseudonocardia benzenivorans]|uniref:Halocarboxylic acid dehydrogenase DehI n=1 Tax=Pseudonocardia benzenivorans TaxID=228005 RepID=A0ABW3VJZ0_9PSEU
MNADPIPAVREEDAVGATAEIFADLRATLGLPFVNLIWRHLATVPDALPAVWSAVRPLYSTAELAGLATGISARARPDGVAPVPREVWATLGVDEAARVDIADLVDFYNRANTINFLVFTTVDALLRGESRPPDPGRRLAASGAPSGAGAGPSGVPPLPPADALSPDLRAVVQACDELGRLGSSTAHASLYRHLALWPPFLATAYVALAPLHRSGALQAAQRDLIDFARPTCADRLLPLLAPARPALDEGVRSRIRSAVEEFASIMIGRMVVAGTVIRALLPVLEEAAVR